MNRTTTALLLLTLAACGGSAQEAQEATAGDAGTGDALAPTDTCCAIRQGSTVCCNDMTGIQVLQFPQEDGGTIECGYGAGPGPVPTIPGACTFLYGTGAAVGTTVDPGPT